MNPGPATSILRTTLWGSSSAATRRSATARGLPLRLLLTGPLVIGDVEAGAFEDKARPPGDLPLRLPAAHGALLPTFVVHRRKEFLEQVPRRAFVFVGGHRTST